VLPLQAGWPPPVRLPQLSITFATYFPILGDSDDRTLKSRISARLYAAGSDNDLHLTENDVFQLVPSTLAYASMDNSGTSAGTLWNVGEVLG